MRIMSVENEMTQIDIKGNGGGTYIAPKSDIRKVTKFYPTVVDNFFDNPDFIRQFGLSLPKQPDNQGRWPGKRSRPIHEINDQLSCSILLKVFSVYFDLSYQNVNWTSSKVYFQQISKYDNSKQSDKNIGWIHTDTDESLAGLVYLNPKIDIDCGTSIHRIKDGERYETFKRQYEKHDLYLNKNISDEEYSNGIKENNSHFEETINFGNVYNRLITYDANEYHKANNFFTEGEDRLTLVFFVNGIDVDKWPLDRVRDKNSYDNFIERKIKNLRTI
tara:strand:+ start:20 stop:844 length:825 start_codon:yes stop_codon:yes gene_type:complete